MRRFIFYLSIFYLFLIAFLSSCQKDEECNKSTESLMKIDFFIIDEGTEQGVNVNDISVYGIGHEDSLLYEHDTISSVLLPLSPASETLGYVLTIGTFKDTVSFAYSINTYLESIECGFISNYEISSIQNSQNTIDTIKIINNIVTTKDEDHIKIFFK